MKITAKEKAQNLTFILPALLLFTVFSLYPILRTFELSVFQWNGIDKDMVFVGLAQYKHILFDNPQFWSSMANAGIITALALTLQNGLALLLALLVTRNIKGENIYRTIFFLPPVLSGIVVGLIWKFVYDGNFGILNHFLSVIGITGFADYAWLGNIKTALFSVAVVHMWKGFGYGFIILLAGLQTIPVELYEAAEVDGADAWQQFKNITFPLLIPIFTIVTILTILGSMQVFDLIYSMTNGGPAGHTDVPITKIYQYMNNGEFGYSTAMAVIFGIVLLIISFAQIYASKKLNYNEK
ncbi:carbohydrate ABC transporter permease [Endomicrobium proavitum]|uniref:ABC-type sugar transport system, permease component n=1 Tax=Endomicrobium proavitum TaxID=1408281 RepID=A0A0G3WIR2_9BACT|nr:sugar ABC transporter permease [Endomicrobium proavitum]AKL97767.1 ABC-type sugar transport system, permease component [Endomicrobium proavitum]